MVTTSVSSAAPVTKASVGDRVVDEGQPVSGASAGLGWLTWPSNAITIVPACVRVAEDHAVVKEGVCKGFIAKS